MLMHDVPAESRDRDSDQRSEHEKQREPGARDNEAEVPASRLPGSAQSEVKRANWLAASSVAVREDM